MITRIFFFVETSFGIKNLMRSFSPFFENSKFAIIFFFEIKIFNFTRLFSNMYLNTPMNNSTENLNQK